MIEPTRTPDTMRSNVTETEEPTQDKLHDLADLASQTYDAGKEKLQAIGENLGDKVQDAPIKALLIAAGAGLLLGILVRRS